MRRIVKVLLVLTPVAILVHDAATGRMSVFRDRYTREEVRLHLFDAVWDDKADEAAFWLRRHGGLAPSDDYGATLLSVAAFRGHVAVTRIILDTDVDVNAQSKLGWDLPEWAQEKRYRHVRPSAGHSALPQFPMRVGRMTALPNWTQEKRYRQHVGRVGGMTALHWGATLGNDEVARLLIEREADVNARDGQGRTPLFLAVINDQDALVGILLRNGADPNMQNASKYTALMLAMLQGRQKITELLLAKGADLNVTNHTGGTALHVAVEAQRRDMVGLLLEYNPEVNAKDRAVRTPLDLATDPEIQSLLREHGGKTGKK